MKFFTLVAIVVVVLNITLLKRNVDGSKIKTQSIWFPNQCKRFFNTFNNKFYLMNSS